MDFSSLFYMFLHSADYILELVVAILFLATSRPATKSCRFGED